MVAESKASVAARFAAFSFPSAADFGNLIDSYTDYGGPATTLNFALGSHSGGGGRILSFSSSVAATVWSAATVGMRLLGASTTAESVSRLGAGTVGSAVLAAATEAVAQVAIGGGAVGRQLFETATIASANAVLGVVSAATTAEVAAGTVSAKYVSPVTFVESLLAPKALATVEATSIGRQVILQGYNVSTVSAMGGGAYNVVFSAPMASAGYTVALNVTQNGAYRIVTPHEAANVSAGGFGLLAVDTSYTGTNLVSNSRVNIAVFGMKA